MTTQLTLCALKYSSIPIQITVGSDSKTEVSAMAVRALPVNSTSYTALFVNCVSSLQRESIINILHGKRE